MSPEVEALYKHRRFLKRFRGRLKCSGVLNLYYNQAQSSQHPKRGTASTKLVLQSSTIQPASETRHCQY